MLKAQKYHAFSTNEIEPKGWLLDQLNIQANGLSGNLDKIWPDIKDSKYVGGDRDGWERVPYWLDGFIPLAYLLKNDDMIARGKKYIDAILANQQEDGWICPCTAEERKNYDIWALLLLSKVLVVYYECSHDERIEPALYKAFENLNEYIKDRPLFNWGKSRWFEGLIAIFWLYEKVNENWLLDLADALCAQGTDYKELFSKPEIQTAKKEWTYDSHVVNMAMALKSSALMNRSSDKSNVDLAERMFDILTRYHGTAIGHFTGDECLAGNSPIQGTELCGVVEAMYSYEVLFAVTGNTSWLDRLEMLAYNALPAAISPDMWTHQYDQMVNQIACIDFKDKPIFLTNSGEAHLFGLEPNFGCCTADFSQGWPKFALSTFYKCDNGIVSAALAPAKVTTTIDEVLVTIELETQYPFRNILNYTITAVEDVRFEFCIRIPKWATSARLNGDTVEKGEFICMNQIWSGTQNVKVEFELETKFDNRPEDMVCLRHGALCYSVAIDECWKKIEYSRDGVDRIFPYCDYEIYPLSKWNYAFWNENIVIEENNHFDMPFSSENPPVRIIANMAQIDWGYEEGYENVCARVPHSRKQISDVQKVILKPYGCSNLRITEMPKLS